MRRISVAIIDFVPWILVIINVLLTTQIVFRANNSIFVIYKLFFAGIIVVNSIIIFLFSVLTKKKSILSNIAAIALVAIVAWMTKKSVSDEEIWEYRNKVVQEIEAGKDDVEDSVINLPDEDIYEKVSDTKRVILAMDGDRTVIYFYRNAGLLEDSSGYVYYSDKIDRNLCKDTYEFINKEHLEGNWFSCSTR